MTEHWRSIFLCSYADMPRWMGKNNWPPVPITGWSTLLYKIIWHWQSIHCPQITNSIRTVMICIRRMRATWSMRCAWCQRMALRGLIQMSRRLRTVPITRWRIISLNTEGILFTIRTVWNLPAIPEWRRDRSTSISRIMIMRIRIWHIYGSQWIRTIRYREMHFTMPM